MTETDERERIRERKLDELQRSAGANGDGPAGEPGDAPGEPVHVDGPAHLGELVDRHGVVLVDFYADWCGPCRMLEPVVAELAAETPAAVAKVDVDSQQALAAEYGIGGVPTLVVFADGEPVEQVVGVREKAHYVGLIEQYAGWRP